MVEKRTIELIPKEIEEVKSRTRILLRFRLVGLSIFAVGAGFSLLAWGSALGQTARLNFTKEGAKAQVVEIARFSDSERKVLGLAAKSIGITEIFAGRSYFSIFLSALQKSVPTGVAITGVSATKDKALVLVSGTVFSYNELAAFLKNLIDLKGGGTLFTDANLTSVSQDTSTGKASFIVEVVMKRDGLKKPFSEVAK